MPRRTGGTGAEAYRVIITRPYRVYPTAGHEEVLGPYGTLSAAKGVRTNETHPYAHKGSTGRVQRAVTNWVDVPE